MYVTDKRTLVLEIMRLGESQCKTLIHDMVNALDKLTETKEYRNDNVSITIHDDYIILLFK